MQVAAKNTARTFSLSMLRRPKFGRQQQPRQHSPHGAHNPSSEHIGGPMDREINATYPDKPGQTYRQANQIGFNAPIRLRLRQQSSKRQVNGRRHHRMARWEAEGRYFYRMRNDIGPRPTISEF